MLYASAMDKKEALEEVCRALQGDRSQKAIAKKAGLTESKVSLYANGRQFPRDESRRKLAIGLGCEGLEQFDRALNLVGFKPELARDPEKLKAAIRFFDVGEDPEKAAAAALETIEDPALTGFLNDFSRLIDEARKAGESHVEGLSSLRRNLIFYCSRAGSPES